MFKSTVEKHFTEPNTIWECRFKILPVLMQTSRTATPSWTPTVWSVLCGNKARSSQVLGCLTVFLHWLFTWWQVRPQVILILPQEFGELCSALLALCHLQKVWDQPDFLCVSLPHDLLFLPGYPGVYSSNFCNLTFPKIVCVGLFRNNLCAITPKWLLPYL